MVLARFRSRLLGSAVIGAGLLSASSLSALATPAELVIGDTSASGETYNVSGTESWSVVTVGNGNGETGTIIIGPGANLESGQVGSYSTTIGNMTGSVGKVFVQGAGAIWTDISEAINVGQSGSGSIEVSGGGVVSAHALNLGFSNDGSGNVLLSGPGTSFTVTVGVTSGYGVGGSGSMTVLDRT